jgi:hypothetical protein
MKHCLFCDSSVVLSPEHSFSLLLKGFELEGFAEIVEITEKIREAEKLPFADIYDEVDEISNKRIMHCVHDQMKCARLELQT